MNLCKILLNKVWSRHNHIKTITVNNAFQRQVFGMKNCCWNACIYKTYLIPTSTFSSTYMRRNSPAVDVKKPSQKDTMSEDNSWVFDSLVCFLHGPVWNAPLQTFVEEKSLIFDPNQEVDETNADYKKIHDEYKNLVDYMLGSFMEEMQITPEQFEMACLEGRNHSGSALNFHQGLFQQIWAANDIRIFIRMMTQRNLELQLQALDLIERKQNSLASDDSETSAAVEESPQDKPIVKRDISTDKEVVNDIVESLEKPSKQEAPESNKFERLNLFFDNEKISSADIKSRQEYLRAQRDKILEIKKQARARQLNETVKKTDRPSSAQVAQKILEGKADEVSQSPEQNEASHNLRIALAKRLRTEVVENQ